MIMIHCNNFFTEQKLALNQENIGINTDNPIFFDLSKLFFSQEK